LPAGETSCIHRRRLPRTNKLAQTTAATAVLYRLVFSGVIAGGMGFGHPL